MFDGVHKTASRGVLDALDQLATSGTLDQLEPEAIYRHLQRVAIDREQAITRTHMGPEQSERSAGPLVTPSEARLLTECGRGRGQCMLAGGFGRN